MNGILSRAPGQSAIRLLLGTHLLLKVQAAIVLLARTQADVSLRVLCGAILVISLFMLIAAIHGGPADDGTSWYLRSRTRPHPGGRL
jgi:hypothetical protein